jgi:hypothetical protein
MFNPKVAQLVEGLTKISLVQKTWMCLCRPKISEKCYWPQRRCSRYFDKSMTGCTTCKLWTRWSITKQVKNRFWNLYIFMLL